MSEALDFDPFEVLGVDASADSATVDRAYKARIRFVHPDIAGIAGLDETKRLNVAREWLLDPVRRAKLPTPAPRYRARPAAPPHRDGPKPPPEAPPSPRPQQPPGWEQRPRRQTRPSWEYDPLEDDPLTFDFGVRTEGLRAFFEAIRALSADERERVTYSLGDEPPLYFGDFKEQLGATLWARSQALADAISRVWDERGVEDTPLLFPTGRVFGNGAVVANAYAQWMMLGDVIRKRSIDASDADRLAARCMSPWEASVGHPRYGTYQREVLAFLDEAKGLAIDAAERLSGSWQRHMGTYLYGRPGEDWFPGALDHPDPLLVSARLAAVDASRIEPPEGLPYQLSNGFRYGLRLTAHVLALGGASTPGRDYLRPWRDALYTNPWVKGRKARG